MMYPKFPRRTLALILFCMVITLGAVGSIFLIYFFNENSTPLFDAPLKSVYVDDKPTQQYRQNLLEKNEYKSDQELLSIYSNYVENDQVQIENSSNSILRASQEFEANRKKQAVSSAKSINSKGHRETYASSDTIYIDDFDRPTYSSKGRGELGNIDYFDTIIVDHKIVDTKKPVEILSSEHPEDAAPSIIYKTRIISEAANTITTNDGELKPRINNKRRWDKTKLLKLKKDDDDIYDSEIETAGSGSGDFFDDTEINEVFIKQLNSRANKKEKLSRKSSKMNNMRKRKKHRFFIRVGDRFISSSPTQSTMSSEDDIRSNWAYQKNFKKLSSYPTNPTIHFSESLKLPIPALFTNSANDSPTSPYNDNFQSQSELGAVGGSVGSTSTVKNSENISNNLREIGAGSAAAAGAGGAENNEAWIETRTRRIMGNVKKSEERSRQLLLCEEAGGGELCRMLFKGHIND